MDRSRQRNTCGQYLKMYAAPVILEVKGLIN